MLCYTSLHMSAEHEGQGIPLTGIHINLEARFVELQDSHGTVARLTFSPTGVIYFQGSPEREALPSPEPSDAAPPVSLSQERERTVTLTGRLKTQPRPGKPDRSGKPTAYARFAAHVEGEQEAHYYLATFHRHTTKIALGLAKEAQITVEGYAHPKANPDAKGLDTFSVINLVRYPGQVPRQRP